jgi:hypothetical protein
MLKGVIKNDDVAVQMFDCPIRGRYAICIADYCCRMKQGFG